MELLAIHYHYIGDENQFRAGIYPVSPERLERQILALRERGYRFIDEADLLAALDGSAQSADSMCLVTFDDSLRSQYELSVPVLEKYAIPAIFFIPTLPYQQSPAVLNVHKLHHLLAAADVQALLQKFPELYEQSTGTHFDMSAVNRETAMQSYRFDDEPTALFKYIVNYHIPASTAELVISKLFTKHVSSDPEGFCSALYMSKAQLNELHKNPLFSLGLHSHTHLNLAESPVQTVEDDLRHNYALLRQMVPEIQPAGISYPFGLLTPADFDAKLKNILPELGIKYGFTTHRGMNTNFDQPFLLKRWNANDVPEGKRPLFSFSN